jgi:hypothetical protein
MNTSIRYAGLPTPAFAGMTASRGEWVLRFAQDDNYGEKDSRLRWIDSLKKRMDPSLRSG